MEKMCEILDIKRSSYYAWLKRPESERKTKDSLLSIEIKRVHRESDNTYGVRRVTAQLKKEGIVCEKNKVYVGDIPYIGTDEGWLYLATVVDLFNREVVGWSMDTTMTRKLVIDAFNASVDKENHNEGLIFHSDRGVQYASYDYQHLLRNNGFLQSMSATGCCYDNACAESFFSSFKKDTYKFQLHYFFIYSKTINKINYYAFLRNLKKIAHFWCLFYSEHSMDFTCTHILKCI